MAKLGKVLLNIGKSVVIGGVKGLPGGGILDELISNKSDKITGEGKINYVRLISHLSVLLLVIAVIFGWIDAETFERILKLVD